MAARKRVRAAALIRAAAVRPDLTPELCQKIVVDCTPKGEPNDRTAPLFELGVVDVEQAMKHRYKIQRELHKIHYAIAQTDIETGPGVLVGDCSDSVLGHAH
jgi:hypothetical protein